MSLPVFAALMAAIAALVGYALWQCVKLLKRKDNPGSSGLAGDMTRRVAAIRADMDAAAAAARQAHAAVEALAPDTPIAAARDTYLAHHPSASLEGHAEPLKSRFAETGHAPFLAILAGLALREPESPGSGRSGTLVRTAAAHVLRQAPPALVAEFADRIEAGDRDRWTWLAGERLVLRETIGRIRPLDEAVAERLAGVDAVLLAHRTMRQVEEAERQLAFYDGRPEVDSTYAMATEFVRWSLLPAPGLQDRFDALVERNSVHRDWRELRLQMDLILIEGNRHGDVEAAGGRIAAWLDDPELSVAEIAAEVAADLIGQGHMDASFRRRVRDGLARMRGRRTDSAALDALEEALRQADGE